VLTSTVPISSGSARVYAGSCDTRFLTRGDPDQGMMIEKGGFEKGCEVLGIVTTKVDWGWEGWVRWFWYIRYYRQPYLST